MILSIILTILIGALVGWIAGIFMKSKHGFWMNCLLGIVGSFIGFGIAHALGFYSSGIVATLIIDVLGTCLLIAIVRLILGKKF
mgnify:CR=1 FL=1